MRRKKRQHRHVRRTRNDSGLLTIVPRRVGCGCSHLRGVRSRGIMVLGMGGGWLHICRENILMQGDGNYFAIEMF